MSSTPFHEVEDVLDRHARRLAGELGRLLVDVGNALRNQAEADVRTARPAGARASAEPTRDDLYREATRLGVQGRSRMTKQELRDAVARARRR